ncbi:16188_t:CDS:1, partial [Cetraspora pellucida]
LENNENLKSLNKYMKNHEIDLTLMQPILLSEKFKFKYVNNLKELTLIRTISQDSYFFFDTLSKLETLHLYDIKDVSFDDIILLKNLKFLIL